DEGVNAFDQRVGQTLTHRQAAPFFVFFFLHTAIATVFLGNFQHAVGGIRAAVQNHIFNALFQLRRQVVIHRQLAGVDDTHAQAVLNGVIQEHRVNGFTHRLVTAEGEGYVGHTTRNLGVGQVVGNELTTVDEIHRVVIVFFNTGGHGEDVWVENNVLRREADFVDQYAVRAFADFVFARFGISLTLFIKRHDHHGRTVAQAAFGFGDEFFFAFFQRYGVHDGLALNAFQTGFDDFPFR